MKIDELILQRQLQQELMRTSPNQKAKESIYAGEIKDLETQNGDQPSFVDTLKQMIQEVNQLNRESRQKQEAFIKGEPVEIHDVMIAAEKAKTSFQLLLEIRNKFLDFYREIIRMQI